MTSVTFTYTDPDGNDHPAVFNPPAVHPVVACELNFVGPPRGTANFTQGLTSSRAIITERQAEALALEAQKSARRRMHRTNARRNDPVLRAVLDANAYVSAAIRSEGPPGQLLEWFRRELPFELVLSPAIIDEVLETLADPKVKRYIQAEIDAPT